MNRKDSEIIVKLIENRGKPINTSQLSKQLKMDYKNTHNIIQRLRKQNLIELESFGKSFNIKLKLEPNPLIFQAECERRAQLLKNKDFQVIYNQLKKINTQFILLLFGSWVKGTQTKHSDIDFLLITDDPEKIQNQINLFPLKIHLTHVKYKDFMGMLNSKEMTVVSEAVQNNIPLIGIEDYYRLMQNAG